MNINQDCSHKRRQQALFRYEAQKLIWVSANPHATCQQYEAAMRAIAARYGV